MTSPAPHIPEALTSPNLNRGTAFDHRQRRALGLTGRLPSAVLTLEDQADVGTPGAALLPNVRNLRALSAVVAEAVYAAAHADGVATKKPENVVQAIADTMWPVGGIDGLVSQLRAVLAELDLTMAIDGYRSIADLRVDGAIRRFK